MPGGCDFAERPDIDALDARLFWSDAVEPGQLSVDAAPASIGDSDAIDFGAFDRPSRLLVDAAGKEHWVLAERGTALSLHICSGTVLRGPVRLNFLLSGFRHLDAQLSTLRGLLTLARTGHLPSRASGSQQVVKYLHMIQTLDWLEENISTRDIAVRFFGRLRVAQDWRQGSDYLRLRIQRLIRSARSMQRYDYRKLLK
ncbi:DNA -binding domain-containing protein [Flavisphingomonas formosensis]|uniref:DNA -binding domain-containing protein n=1 Tax=Flavisphingomonas formosensis TaxID=861534 RepID=UPI0012F97479|nr:DUF2285 domain-containing protein [Sphingomonas formosensis]